MLLWRIDAHRGRQHGANLVETAFVLPVALLLVIGGIDLGRGVYTRNFLAEIAREGARYAIVHGSNATYPIGPTANNATVNRVCRNYAVGLQQSSLDIQSRWLGGTNNAGSSVTVTANYYFRPIIYGIVIRMSSSSTMTIVY